MAPFLQILAITSLVFFFLALKYFKDHNTDEYNFQNGVVVYVTLDKNYTFYTGVIQKFVSTFRSS